MSSALVLIVVVAGGYLAAHVASDWLGRRFMVVSGAEYLLLGILLGPQVSGLIGADVFGGFAPFLTLALGWVGVVVGAQFSLPELVRIPAPLYRIAFFEAALTLVAVSAAMLGVFTGLLGTLPEEAVFPAVALGAVATASAPTGIGLVARRLGWRGAWGGAARWSGSSSSPPPSTRWWRSSPSRSCSRWGTGPRPTPGCGRPPPRSGR